MQVGKKYQWQIGGSIFMACFEMSFRNLPEAIEAPQENSQLLLQVSGQIKLDVQLSLIMTLCP